MGADPIDPILRRRVRRRAQGRCEYCGYPDAACYAAFHCDHCLPASRGGATTLANLAWACPTCNASKADRTTSLDRVTGQVQPLFNPRKDTWEAHFSWAKDGLILRGTTPVGRATVRQLRMNRRGVRVIRMLLLQAGLHPMQE